MGRLDFLERCADLHGAAVGEGAFAPGPALWVGTREVVHFHEGELEVRLTKAVIRARRDELAADGRVTLRGRSSDWLSVRFGPDDDSDGPLDLVRDAVEANRPTAPPGLPPEGADLQRRRRFH